MNSVIPLLVSLTCMFGWGVENFLMAKISRTIGAVKGGALIQFLAFLITLIFIPLFFTKNHFEIIQPMFLGLLTAVTFVMFCKAMNNGNLTLIMPIVESWSLVTSILGIIFFRESVTIYKILSIVFVISGIVMLSVDWPTLKSKSNFMFSGGVVLAMLVSLGFGISNFWIGIFSRQTDWFYASISNRFFAVIFLFLIAVITGESFSIKKINLPWILILATAMLDVVSFTAFNLGVSRFEVSYVSIIASSSPLITILMAVIFFREKTVLIQKLGIFSTLLGIILLQLK